MYVHFAAERRISLEEPDAAAARGQPNRCGETAQASADDDDGWDRDKLTSALFGLRFILNYISSNRRVATHENKSLDRSSNHVEREKILALILAGGEGGRLDVLTEQRAKPAMPFAGTYRLIDFALSNCVHSKITDVWVIEQYEPYALNDHLANGRPWDLDRTYGGLQVLPPYAVRADVRTQSGFAHGNADAIYRNRRFIREFAPDVIVVLSADHVYKLDYRAALARHHECGADVTLVTTRVAPREAHRFGVVKVNEADGRITDFAYKPKRPESDLVTTEVFIYRASKLLDTLEALARAKQTSKRGVKSAGEKKSRRSNSSGGDDGGESSLKDFGHELLPQLVGEGRAYEYRLNGYWRDLGTIESYWQGHMDLLHTSHEGLALDDAAWPILTYGAQRMPARLGRTARFENSLIASGCVIEGEVTRSVLAPGVRVEKGARVRDSVLLRDVIVEAGAMIDCAIVDENAVIGQRARIGQARRTAGRTKTDARRRMTDDLITLIGKRAEIAARARVPVGARVKPPKAQDD